MKRFLTLSLSAFFLLTTLTSFTWQTSLGLASFASDNTWTISNDTIRQIWSDAVQTDYCSDKTTFAGGNSTDGFRIDCRSNPEFSGDLFSWRAVAEIENLCPYPWRVPTMQDFRDLDIVMGGSGNNRGDTPQFVQENYITRWGGAFGGGSGSVGTLRNQGIWGHYWSSTEGDATLARNLNVNTNGLVSPQNWSNRGGGLSLRCVQ